MLPDKAKVRKVVRQASKYSGTIHFVEQTDVGCIDAIHIESTYLTTCALKALMERYIVFLHDSGNLHVEMNYKE